MAKAQTQENGMQGTMIKIAADGTRSDAPLTSPPELKVLQEGVGGWIEMVPGFEKFEGVSAVVFCNEEGKLNGLPVNMAASYFWYAALGRHAGDVLVGDVVIITGDDELLGEL